MKNFNRPYVRDWFSQFYPIYLPGETYSFYLNSDYLLDLDTESYHWELFIIKSDGTQLYGFGRLSLCNITPSLINPYMESFLFPILPDGYYQFQIWSNARGIEAYRSNPIQVSSNCLDVTSYVKFRHDDQLFGVRYDLLPNFYQRFRLPINQIKPPEIRSERQQYRQSSGGRELRNSKSFRDIVLTLEGYWMDDDDIQALSAINEHSEVYVDRNRLIQLTQIKTEKGSEFSRLTKATFEIIVDDYNLNYNTYENWGECCFWGGNPYSIPSVIVAPQ